MSRGLDLAGLSRRRSWADLRFIVAGNGRGIVALLLLAVVTACAEVFLLGALVQGASALSSDSPTVDLHLGPWSAQIAIAAFLGAAVVAAVIRAGCAAASAVLGPRVTGASRERHRRDLLDAYLFATWAAQAADRTGRLQQTFSTSINEVNAIVLVATVAMTALVTLVVLIAVALILSAPITGILLVAGVVIHFALRPVSVRSRLAAGLDADTRLASAAHVSAVAAAGAEILVLGATDAAATTGRRLIGTAEAAFARSNSLRQLGVTSVQSLAFVVAAGGLLSVAVFDLPVDFTVLGTVALLLLRAAGLANQVQASVGLFGQLSPFISQVREMTADFASKRRAAGSSPFPADFEISLDGVRYVYPETTSNVLDIDRAVIEQGTSVAVLGPSGSGKSTLIQLLLCLRDPTEGHVRVGGLDVRSIRPEEFSRRVSFVPQAPHLVPGTVRENIRFFREWASDAQIESCARLAHIHDEIMRMPAGYETRLDSHVDMLSGGQKQRLSMARALVADPAILVLDEPTSALDPVNERLVVQTLAAMRGERTVVIITHRESTVAGCDVMMSLHEGRLTVLGGGAGGRPPVDADGAAGPRPS